jgi:hypothetical protein
MEGIFGRRHPLELRPRCSIGMHGEVWAHEARRAKSCADVLEDALLDEAE